MHSPEDLRDGAVESSEDECEDAAAAGPESDGEGEGEECGEMWPPVTLPSATDEYIRTALGGGQLAHGELVDIRNAVLEEVYIQLATTEVYPAEIAVPTRAEDRVARACVYRALRDAGFSVRDCGDGTWLVGIPQDRRDVEPSRRSAASEAARAVSIRPPSAGRAPHSIMNGRRAR